MKSENRAPEADIEDFVPGRGCREAPSAFWLMLCSSSSSRVMIALQGLLKQEGSIVGDGLLTEKMSFPNDSRKKVLKSLDEFRPRFVIPRNVHSVGRIFKCVHPSKPCSGRRVSRRY
jgi:hypothetical protein